MLKFRSFLSWKILAIVALAIVLGYVDLPDGFQKIPGTPDAVKNSKVHLGLDLQGGTQLDYKVDLRKVKEKDQRAILEGVREVINKRVNVLGVSEPNIFLSKIGSEDHIIVELAGVKNLEEAKKAVGKTIQLEFKEERGEPDPKEKDNIRKQAQAVLQRVLKQPGSFTVISEEEALAGPGKVKHETVDFVKKEEFPDQKIAEEIFKAPIGKIIPKLLEGNNGYTFEFGQLKSQEGLFIINVLEKKDFEEEIKVEKEVSASHILIAYQGAERAGADVTRTKAEAENFAEELLAKIQKGEIKFEDAAKQNSDEPNAENTAGKLPDAVKKGGSYVPEFTDAALGLENVGDLSDITETSFGYHIIRADSVIEEGIKKETVAKVKYEQLFYSTVPDPWVETGLTGEHFVHADVTFDQLYQPIVNIEFDDEGAKLFEQITERNVDKRLAVFVGGNLISAPRVNQKISGGKAVITGQSTAKEAQDLARDLNTGAIPAPIVLAGQYSIGATLGQSALNQSVKAGLIGFAVVVIFMILYYRLPGLIASIALGVYAVLFLFLLKASLPITVSLGIAVAIFLGIVYKILHAEESGWEKLIGFVLSCFILFLITFLLATPVVLTLAGIAGVILSLGMAVDANILIFERLKEELKAGRPLSSAIEVGFDRAWSSIRDSNFSSLITTAILFYLGTSIIKGFALTLAAGIILSMFTAITVTRAFLLATVNTRLGQKLWLFGIPKGGERKTLDFVGKKKIWFSFSGVLILIGIIGMVVSGVRHGAPLNFGIDFRGGSLMDVKLEKTATPEEVKRVLTDIEVGKALASPSAPAKGDAGPTLSQSESAFPKLSNATVVPSEGNRFILRTEHMDEKAHEEILQALEAKFGKVEENRFTTLGPAVGDTLKRRALLALGIALVAIVLYIAFAFRNVPRKYSPWKFGIAAIIALLHDVFIPTGIFALFGIEVDLLFITALLTILGFSVHDTIVVFDRIRENLKYQAGDESFAHTANVSLSQTVARSINTSFTVLLTLLALLIFGSSSIFYFVLALVLGVVVGTYSSIFIASPILVMWQNSRRSGAKPN